jgi:hypothetical protein
MADEKALLDSGATENFIDETTWQRLGIGRKELKRPITVTNVDGTVEGCALPLCCCTHSQAGGKQGPTCLCHLPKCMLCATACHVMLPNACYLPANCLLTAWPVTPVPMENKRGKIMHYCWLRIQKGTRDKLQRFFITDLGQDRIILGYPFLYHFNPPIDWTAGRICGAPIQLQSPRYKYV